MRRSQSVREKPTSRSPGPFTRRRQSERVRHKSADSTERSSFSFPWGNPEDGSLHRSRREQFKTGPQNRSSEDRNNAGLFDSFRGMTQGNEQKEKNQLHSKDNQPSSFMGMFGLQNNHEKKPSAEKQHGWNVFGRDHTSKDQDSQGGGGAQGGHGIKSMFKNEEDRSAEKTGGSGKGLFQMHPDSSGRKGGHAQKELTQDRRRSRKSPKQQTTVDLTEIQDKISGFFGGFGK